MTPASILSFLLLIFHVLAIASASNLTFTLPMVTIGSNGFSTGFYACSSDNVAFSCSVNTNIVSFPNYPNTSSASPRIIYRGEAIVAAGGTLAVSYMWEYQPQKNTLWYTNSNQGWGGDIGRSGCSCTYQGSNTFLCCSPSQVFNKVSISFS